MFFFSINKQFALAPRVADREGLPLSRGLGKRHLATDYKEFGASNWCYHEAVIGIAAVTIGRRLPFENSRRAGPVVVGANIMNENRKR